MTFPASREVEPLGRWIFIVRYVPGALGESVTMKSPFNAKFLATA